MPLDSAESHYNVGGVCSPMMKRETVYFNPDQNNTEATIKAAKRVALDQNIKYVVVASSSGATGVKVAEAFKDTGIKVVVVTLFATSTTKPSEERLTRIKELGGVVVTGTHALMGVPESLSKVKEGYVTPNMVIRETLRRFSQGTNVCADIVMMATDTGVVPPGVEVIAISGMGANCDTAWIIKSCGSFNFFEKVGGFEFLELVALPRQKKFW